MLHVVRAIVKQLEVISVYSLFLVDLYCNARNLLIHLSPDMAFWRIQYMLLVAVPDGIWSRMLKKEVIGRTGMAR